MPIGGEVAKSGQSPPFCVGDPAHMAKGERVGVASRQQLLACCGEKPTWGKNELAVPRDHEEIDKLISRCALAPGSSRGGGRKIEH